MLGGITIGSSKQANESKNDGAEQVKQVKVQESRVPYSGITEDRTCFVCKEKLTVMREGVTEAAVGEEQLVAGTQVDENTYFVNAKRIRVTVRNKESNEPEKREANVHVDCMKQLENLRKQK